MSVSLQVWNKTVVHHGSIYSHVSSSIPLLLLIALDYLFTSSIARNYGKRHSHHRTLPFRKWRCKGRHRSRRSSRSQPGNWHVEQPQGTRSNQNIARTQTHSKWEWHKGKTLLVYYRRGTSEGGDKGRERYITRPNFVRCSYLWHFDTTDKSSSCLEQPSYSNRGHLKWRAVENHSHVNCYNEKGVSCLKAHRTFTRVQRTLHSVG